VGPAHRDPSALQGKDPSHCSCYPEVLSSGPARLQHHKEQRVRWIPLGEGAEVPLEILGMVCRHTGVLTCAESTLFGFVDMPLL